MVRIKIQSIEAYHGVLMDTSAEKNQWTQVILNSGITLDVIDTVEEIDRVILGLDPPARDEQKEARND